MNDTIPWFGARKAAQRLLTELKRMRQAHDTLKAHLDRLGALTLVQMEERKATLK